MRLHISLHLFKKLLVPWQQLFLITISLELTDLMTTSFAMIHDVNIIGVATPFILTLAFATSFLYRRMSLT